MSDFFQRVQQGTTGQKQPGNFFDKVQGNVTAMDSRRETVAAKLPGALPVTDWEYDIISRALDSSQDPEAEAYKWATAIQYSRFMDKPIDEVMGNFDAYNEFWLGKKYTAPKDNWAALADSAKIGPLQLQQAQLATQWMKSGGSDEALKSQIDAIQQEIDGLSNYPKPWLTEAVKYGAAPEGLFKRIGDKVGDFAAAAADVALTSLPQTLQIGAAGLTAGAAATAAGITAAAAGGATILSGGALGLGAGAATVGMFSTAAGTLGAFAESLKLAEGLEYYRMRQNGIPNEIAAPLASTSGAVQSFVEVALGNVPGLLGKLGGQATQTISTNVIKRLAVSGKIGAAAKAISGYLGEALEEGAEEGIQQLVSAGTDSLAAELAANGVEAPKAQEVASQVWESAKGGFMASLIMGIPGSLVQYRGDAKEAKALKNAAQTMTEEAFISSASEAGLATLEGLSPEQKTEALQAIYQAQESKRPAPPDPSKAKAETGIVDPANVYRKEGGRIYTELSTLGEREDESETVTDFRLKFGNPDTQELNGFIEGRLRTAEDGTQRVEVSLLDYDRPEENEITEPGMEVEDDTDIPEAMRPLFKEAMVELAAQYPGIDIEWNAVTEGERQILSELEAESPTGKLQRFNDLEPAERQMKWQELETKLAEIVPDFQKSENREAFRAPLELIAKKRGLTLDELIGEKGLRVRLGDTNAAALNKEGTANAGISFMDQAGTSMPALKVTREDLGKLDSVITLTKTADLPTVSHEFFHAIERLWFDDQEVAAFEKALGKQRKEWSRDDIEELADRWFQYLESGQAPDPELKTIFQKLAQAFRQFIEEIKVLSARYKGRYAMSPQFRTAYDNLFQASKEGQGEAQDADLEIFHTKGVDREAIEKNTDPATKPKMKVKTLDEAYALVGAAREEFTTWTEEVRSEVGGRIKARSDLKKRDRAERKITAEEGPESILDLDGKTIVFEKLEDVETAAKLLQAMPEVLRIKDRFVKPTKVNYMDFLMNVQMSNGAIVELQLTTENMIEAKDKGGHVFYEVQDNIEQAERDGKIDAELADSVITICVETQTKLYSEAFASTLTGAIFKASSFDMGTPSRQISELLQDAGAFERVLSEKTRNMVNDLSSATGLSSQSRNSSPGSLMSIGASETSINEGSSEGNGLFHTTDGTLAVLHNMNAEDILRVEEFGGMPMPSIAITRPDLAFTQFGDSTLIADPSVAREAMAEGRLFDRDIWSPTVPSPDWKVNKKLLDKFDSKWRLAGKEVGDYVGVDSLNSSDVEGGAIRFAGKVKNYSATKYLYLKDRGVQFSPIMAPKVPDHNIPIELALEVKKYLDANPMESEDYYGDHFDGASRVIADFAARYAKDEGVEDIADSLAERWTRGNTVYSVMRFAKEYDPYAMVVDSVATEEALDKLIDPARDDYERWLRAQVSPIYSNPTIKTGKQRVPFNAESVLDWMLSQNTRASQDTMTYGPNKAASMAGRPFNSREQIANEEGRLVSEEESRRTFEETIKPLNEELMAKLPDFYRYDDRWEALDSVFKAIGEYLKGGISKESPERMKKAMSSSGFAKVPASLVNTAITLAHRMADRAQDYYEAKPAKILHLSDFRAAVIPSDTSAETKEAIKDTGLMVYEYATPEDRPAIVRKALAEIPDVLFHTRDELISEAANSPTPEDFRSLMEFYADADDEQTTSDLSEAQKAAWYEGIWKEGQARRAAELAAIMPKDPDEAFIEGLRKKGGLEEFLAQVWSARVAQSQANQAGIEDAAEYAEVERLEEIRQKVEKIAHPLVVNASARVGKQGRALKPETRKAILTIIEHGVLDYRAIDAEIRGDEQAIAETRQALEERTQKFGTLKDPRAGRQDELTIADRVRLGKAFENQEIRKRIESGDYTTEDLDAWLKASDEEQKTLKTQREQLRAELEASKAKLDTKEGDLEWTADRLAATKKELATIDKKIAKAAKRVSQDPAAMEAELATRKSVSERFDALDEEYKAKLAQVRDQGRIKARERIKAAIEKTETRLRGVAARKKAAVELREKKIKLADQIMLRPSDKTVNFEEAEAIRAIQKLLDPKFRRATIKWRGEIIKIETLRENPQMMNDIGLEKSIIDRISKKSLDQWTVAELERLKDQVENLFDVGRAKLAAKKAERKLQNLSDRNAVSFAVETSGRYVEPAPYSSKELEDQIKERDRKNFGLLSFENMERVAIMLDGGKPGIFHSLLVSKEREARRRERLDYERRTNPVVAVMEQYKIKLENLSHKNIILKGIWSSSDGSKDKDATVSKSDLMFYRLALRVGVHENGDIDEDSRLAALVGNFFSESEKEHLENDDLRARAAYKERIIQRAIAENLSEGEIALSEAMAEDWTKEFDRLNQTMIDNFNHSIPRVQFYVPLVRQEATFDDFRQELLEASAGGAGIPVNVKAGSENARNRIGAKHQKPVKTDLAALYFDNVKKTEHLIAYTTFVRNVNAVFKGKAASKVRQDIRMSYGRSALDYIDAYIADMANPHHFQNTRNLDKAIRMLRGNLGTAYLGLRLATIAKQAITSPLPYIAYAGAFMPAASFQAMSHPTTFLREVEGMSAILRGRTSNAILEAIQLAGEEGIGKTWKQGQQIMMKGIEYADRISVAIGWKACYDKARAGGMDHEAALREADDVTLKIQPSANPADLAPLFKTKGEAWKILTQFMMPLNVVYQNIWIDAPRAVKNGEYMKAIGIGVSYALAGVALTMLFGPQGDDDEDKKAGELAFAAFSQATDSVPLIGGFVSDLARTAITGESEGVYRSDPFPAVSKLFTGATKISEALWEDSTEKLGAGILQTIEGAGLATGVPISAMKEISRIPDVGLGALLGRRE